MRFPLTALAILTFSLGFAACKEDDGASKQSQDAKPAAQNAAAEKAVTKAPTAKEAAKTKPRVLEPRSLATAEELETYIKATELMLQEKWDAFDAATAKIEGWRELNAKVGRALFEYDAMQKHGITPDMDAALKAAYDKVLAVLKTYRDAK